MSFKLFTKEPYREIKIMVSNYSRVMKSISLALKRSPQGPQLDISNEPIGFYITPEELTGAIETISKIEGFNKYLALFGIENETDRLTVCLVGADKDGKILEQYKKDDTTFGEEKWPTKTSLTLSNTDAELDNFLNKI